MARKPAPPRVLGRLLESSLSPIYLCDAQGRFAFGNAAFEKWLDVSVEKLVGLPMPYSTATTGAAVMEVTSSLAPPPDAYQGARRQAVIAAPLPTGATTRRRVDFVPLPAENDDCAVLAIVAPVESNELDLPDAVANSAAAHAALAELRRSVGSRFMLPQLIGSSRPLRHIREQLQLAAISGARTLIVGPPGSGREHVARTIHQLRGGGALAPLQGAAASAEQLQAAVMALLRRPQAVPGTKPTLLVLDVDQLDSAAQLELSGLLQLPGMEFTTLATARRSLHRLAQRSRYRSDLAYALSTLTLKLPALNKRPEDVPLLAQFFLEQANAQGGKQLSGFSPEALDDLAGYEWPGNIQELSQVVAEACAQARGLTITPAELPSILRIAADAVAHPKREVEKIQLDAVLEEVEKEILGRALTLARNNKTLAAELVGISRQRLIRRLVQFGLVTPTPEEAVIFEPVEEPPPRGEQAS